MTFLKNPLIAILSLIFYLTGSLGCYSVGNDFIYSYHWKVRKDPIYTGNSVKELLALCINGCGSDCPIVDCDQHALAGLRHAQMEVRDYQVFTEHVLIYLIARVIPLIIIILMNFYLFSKGHFRLRDFFSRNIENQWQLEEDPTSGLETHIWENMKVTAEKTTDKNAKPDRREGYILNPIRRGIVFWKFRKIMNLFYGRERYYRLARYFNPLKWQIQNLGIIDIDAVNKTENPEPPEYEWNDDQNQGDAAEGSFDVDRITGSARSEGHVQAQVNEQLRSNK